MIAIYHHAIRQSSVENRYRIIWDIRTFECINMIAENSQQWIAIIEISHHETGRDNSQYDDKHSKVPERADLYKDNAEHGDNSSQSLDEYVILVSDPRNSEFQAIRRALYPMPELQQTQQGIDNHRHAKESYRISVVEQFHPPYKLPVVAEVVRYVYILYKQTKPHHQK